jgi:ribonuclease BN (tRNA processing enzyme)
MDAEERFRVTFVGVGEAFDEALGNTSVLVSTPSTATGGQVLLDCGFTAAHAFWRCSPDPMGLDAVWVSHFHGDHFFGIPLLLLRFWEERRERPLTLVGQAGLEDRIRAAMELAYPGFLDKLQYELSCLEAAPGRELERFGLRWSFAETGHSSPCLALRLANGRKALFYSGDGAPTPATLSLAEGCDLIVHEAFGLDQTATGHGTVEACVKMATTCNAKALALVHVNRDVRRDHAGSIRSRLNALDGVRAFLPEPGDQLKI